MRAIRLGMGGGYYDATFAANGDALLIGLAHELQRHEGLRASSRGTSRSTP